MRNDYYQLAVCDNDTCTDCGVTPRSNQGEWSLVKCDLLGDQVVLRKVVASVFQLVEVDIHGYSKFIIPYLIYQILIGNIPLQTFKRHDGNDIYLPWKNYSSNLHISHKWFYLGLSLHLNASS